MFGIARFFIILSIFAHFIISAYNLPPYQSNNSSMLINDMTKGTNDLNSNAVELSDVISNLNNTDYELYYYNAAAGEDNRMKIPKIIVTNAITDLTKLGKINLFQLLRNTGGNSGFRFKESNTYLLPIKDSMINKLVTSTENNDTVTSTDSYNYHFLEFNFGDSFSHFTSPRFPISTCFDQTLGSGGSASVNTGSSSISTSITLSGSVVPTFQLFGGATFNYIQLSGSIGVSLSKSLSSSISCSVPAGEIGQIQKYIKLIEANNVESRSVSFNILSGLSYDDASWKERDSIKFIANGFDGTGEICTSDPEQILCHDKIFQSEDFTVDYSNANLVPKQ